MTSILGVLIAIVAVIAGAYIAISSKSNGPSASDAAAVELQALQEQLQTSLAFPDDYKKVPEFSLLGTDGTAITHDVFNDQWSLVFFGYTHCPDVCPITLQVMKILIQQLDESSVQKPQIVFVSVDPVRDTSDVMKKYIGYFDPDFVGITGDMKALHDMTRSLGIVASFTANDDDPDNYLVDHTASLLLIDPEGRVRAKISPPHDASTIAADYKLIVGTPS